MPSADIRELHNFSFLCRTPRTPRVRRTLSRMRSMWEVAEAAAEDADAGDADAVADLKAAAGRRTPLRRVLGSTAACAGLLAGLLVFRPWSKP